MNIPATFLDSLPIPESEKSDFLHALHQPPPVSIRLNTSKAKLCEEQDEIPWCTNGYYLKSRPRFTSDPAFHAGAYYPQEASSMFLSFILKALNLDRDPLKVLDLCAAPGGKSGILRTDLHPDSFLVSNEVIKSRVNLLEETLIKLGRPGFMVTSADPSAFASLPHYFDLMVVDAPCSGEGLFRKQESAIEHWSPEAVGMCSARQKRILNDIWPSLAPGGKLIYSTCTYNRKENEDNLAWLSKEFGAISVQIPLSDIPEIEEVEASKMYGYRFMPHRTTGEGLFIAVLQKPDEQRKKKSKRIVPIYQKAEVPLLDSKNYTALADQNQECYAVHQAHIKEINTVAAALKDAIPGISIGKFYSKKFKPAHGLSQILFSNHLPEGFSLTHEEAILYLEKNEVSKLNLKKLIYTMDFEGFRLGFAKTQQNRLISKYPTLWRIRYGVPEKYRKIVEAKKY